MKEIINFMKDNLFGIILFIIIVVRIINGIRYPKKGDYTIDEKRRDNPLLNKEAGRIKKIDNNRAQGFHMIPREKTNKGIVIVFGGSEGSSNYEKAYEIYSKGYEVLSLYFFGQKNQLMSLSKVDLSFFKDVEDYIEKERIDNSIVTILGASKGAELGLLLTQYYNIDNLVLYAPSAYIFEGERNTSSWMHNGKELPYISYQISPLKIKLKFNLEIIFNHPANFRELYKYITKNLTSNDDSWIYKKPINGNILIFAGGEDKVWNGDEMGQVLKNEYPNQIEFHLYKDAGHVLDSMTYFKDMAFGGTKEINYKAKIESDKILFERLVEWHK